MYITLGNLHDYNRSTVDQIQLVLLCKEKYFKYFGSEKVFKKLVEDIHELETIGIYISPHRALLGVAFILGDNLNSHAIGEFEQNFSTSEYLCRYCLLQRRVFKGSILLEQAEERSRKGYEQCIEYLKVNDICSNLGVQFDSPFNTLKSFHLCGPGLLPFLAHDLFEGAVSYHVHIFLMYLIKRKKWFSIDLLSKRITDCKYRGRDSLDKPAKVKGSPTEKLSGHAIQNWNFLKLLPLIIADKIQDINDQV
ncbi:hypothetical protein HOLleu_10176 [Holothuria leucospilota]|uniref:Uncharacterized protein n=1 Tax=Holothuria leucospilota TaxID=206669 RepID=A0A9Q1CEE4_HOLLE|nr:hypothetical protein HOLleu_10176 [Holothuria leucospilota]